MTSRVRQRFAAQTRVRVVDGVRVGVADRVRVLVDEPVELSERHVDMVGVGVGEDEGATQGVGVGGGGPDMEYVAYAIVVGALQAKLPVLTRQ